MTGRPALAAVMAVVAAIAVGSCGPPTPSSPSVSGPIGPTGAPTSSPATTDVSSASPSASAFATSSPSELPSPSTSQSATCPLTRQTVRPPSDRLVDLTVGTSPTVDVARFVFGDPSLAGPPGTPTSILTKAKPPYTRAGSGASIHVIGARVAQLRFDHMSTINDIGEPTYTGRTDLKPGLRALRHLVLYDDSEGIVGWFIGFDGPGCVTLGTSGMVVTVSIRHP